jgi:hypothetical protein
MGKDRYTLMAGRSDSMIALLMGHADMSFVPARYGCRKLYHSGIDSISFGHASGQTTQTRTELGAALGAAHSPQKTNPCQHEY